MIIKWQTGGYHKPEEPIRRRECTRETDHSVWIRCSGGESRLAKIADFQQIHDTWEQARDYLADQYRSYRASYLSAAENMQERLDIVLALECPKDEQ